MNFTADITERLSLGKLKSIKNLKSLEELNLPPSLARHLLAYLHSGEVLRHSLPRLLRIGAVLWLFFFVLMWIAGWSGIYEEFERWGLVKAYFAQIISIATAFLVVRITMLRAGHLQVIPPDDFVNLRALAVLCRWFGEIALVYVVGRGLSALLQPVSAPMNTLLNDLSPGTAGEVSSGTPTLLLLSGPLSLFFVSVAVSLFLGLYAAATAIDVYLAIEFNTRPERVGKGVSLGGV
jgi:hypothetical protein